MIFSGAAQSFKTLNPAGSDQAWETFFKARKVRLNVMRKTFAPHPSTD
jgi:hypothetical protein